MTVNQFQTLDMPVTNYYANGVAYASTQKSMMPLSVQQPNKPTQLNSGVGNVTAVSYTHLTLPTNREV